MYYFNSRVRYSETDEKGRLSIPAIVDYFQDTSTFQAEDLGIGLEWLGERGLVWMLTSWQIVVSEYPRPGDMIRVGTFPYALKGVLGLRNFVIEGGDGRRLVVANSTWTLMDIRRGMPTRLPQEMLDAYTMEEKLPMEYAPRHIGLAGDPAPCTAFAVSRQHLDGNHHVNNAQYIQMAMDELPEEFPVRQVRAEYKKQARLHDVIHPFAYESGTCFTVSLDGEDGQPYAIVEFR